MRVPTLLVLDFLVFDGNWYIKRLRLGTRSDEIRSDKTTIILSQENLEGRALCTCMYVGVRRLACFENFLEGNFHHFRKHPRDKG